MGKIKQVINYRTSGTSLPSPSNMAFGELAIQYNSDVPKLIIKKADGTLAEFVDWNYALDIINEKAAAELAERETADKTLDAKIDAIGGDGHTHSNKTVLDGITAEKVSVWDTAGQAVPSSRTINGKPLSSNVTLSTSDLLNDSNFIDKNVNDLVNYYDKDSVDDLIEVIKQFDVVLANELPTASESVSKAMYLIPSTAQANAKDEYIAINENGTYRWEQIGSTAIDFTNYYTKSEVDDLLEGKVDNVSGGTVGDSLVKTASGVEWKDTTPKVVSIYDLTAAEIQDIYNNPELYTLEDFYGDARYHSTSYDGTTRYFQGEVTTHDEDFAIIFRSSFYDINQDGTYERYEEEYSIPSGQRIDWMINSKQDEISESNKLPYSYISGTPEIPDVSIYYTSGQTDAKIADAIADETARTESTYLKEHQSLDGYYTKSEVDEALSSKADESDLEEAEEIVARALTDIDERLSGVNNLLVDKIDEPEQEGTNGQVLTTDGNGGRRWTTVQGGGGVTSGEVETMILSAIADETARTESAYLKEHQSLDAYYTSAQTASKIADAIASETARTESTYLKEHQSLDAYYTSAQTDTAIANYADSYASGAAVGTIDPSKNISFVEVTGGTGTFGLSSELNIGKSIHVIVINDNTNNSNYTLTIPSTINGHSVFFNMSKLNQSTNVMVKTGYSYEIDVVFDGTRYHIVGD